MLERLDRFYVSDWVIGKGGQFGVVPRMTLLDHALGILTLDLIAPSLASRSCKIPNSMYIREEVHSQLIKL